MKRDRGVLIWLSRCWYLLFYFESHLGFFGGFESSPQLKATLGAFSLHRILYLEKIGCLWHSCVWPAALLTCSMELNVTSTENNKDARGSRLHFSCYTLVFILVWAVVALLDWVIVWLTLIVFIGSLWIFILRSKCFLWVFVRLCFIQVPFITSSVCTGWSIV